MVRYPHTIAITVASDPVQSGVIWTAGASTTKTYKCRAETGTGGKIAGADGAIYEYSFMVYLPRITDVIPQDSSYVLTMDNATVSGKVKGASNGQLNSRIWL